MLLDSPLVLFPLMALGLSVILHALTLVLFPRWGLLDFPERYGLKRSRIPYPTGIVPVVIFLVLIPIFQPLDAEILGLMGGVALLGAVCFIDDRRRLPPMLRLGIQLLVAILLIACGIRIDAVTNPLPALFGPDGSVTLNAGLPLVLSVVFTMGWLLLTINALNWFDGVAGQVSTLSTIGFTTIGFLSISERVNQPSLALIAFTLAGISFGCLFFELPPPRLLMGDTGAMFFGLMIGVLTIYSGGKVATAFLVLGIPLTDVFFVIVRRLKKGQSPLTGDSRDQHLHHRLLAKGWSPRQIILLTSLIGAAFGLTALFLSTWGKVVAAGVLMMVMVGLSMYSKPKVKH